MNTPLVYQTRSELPPSLIDFLDRQSGGELKAITWIEPDRLKFTAHYDKDGAPFESRTFRYKGAIQQAKGAPVR